MITKQSDFSISGLISERKVVPMSSRTSLVSDSNVVAPMCASRSSVNVFVVFLSVSVAGLLTNTAHAVQVVIDTFNQTASTSSGGDYNNGVVGDNTADPGGEMQTITINGNANSVRWLGPAAGVWASDNPIVRNWQVNQAASGDLNIRTQEAGQDDGVTFWGYVDPAANGAGHLGSTSATADIGLANVTTADTFQIDFGQWTGYVGFAGEGDFYWQSDSPKLQVKFYRNGSTQFTSILYNMGTETQPVTKEGGTYTLNMSAVPGYTDGSISGIGIWLDTNNTSGVVNTFTLQEIRFGNALAAAVVPEPSSLVLAVLGLVGLAMAGRRKKARRCS